MSETEYEKENCFKLVSRSENKNYGVTYSLIDAFDAARKYPTVDEISFYKKRFDGYWEQIFLNKNASNEWVIKHISVTLHTMESNPSLVALEVLKQCINNYCVNSIGKRFFRGFDFKKANEFLSQYFTCNCDCYCACSAYIAYDIEQSKKKLKFYIRYRHRTLVRMRRRYLKKISSLQFVNYSLGLTSNRAQCIAYEKKKWSVFRNSNNNN